MEIPLVKRHPYIMLGFHTAVHVIGFFCFSAGFITHFVFRMQQESLIDHFLSCFKYLSTFILLIHMFYCVFSFVLDLKTFRIISKQKYIEFPPEELENSYAVKDFIEGALAFPFGIFTSSFFLTLKVIFKKHYFGYAQARNLPWWIILLAYSFFIVFQILETISFSRKPPNLWYSILALLFTYLMYIVWLVVIFILTSLWVYPDLHMIEPFTMILVFTFIYFLLLLIFAVGRFINNLLWDPNEGYQLCPFFVREPLQRLSRSSVWMQNRMSRLWSVEPRSNKKSRTISISVGPSPYTKEPSASEKINEKK